MPRRMRPLAEASKTDWKLSIAPMMDRTDRHFRYFLRLITRRTRLYSEMITTQAILHGSAEKLLAFDPVERPLALQLGGNDPEKIAACTRIAAQMGYDEVNLNVGCPSERVQQGTFGAALMATPSRVKECIAAARSVTSMPITLKHRIGIAGEISLVHYDDLSRFVDTVAQGGCRTFIVHARIAILGGLSPKDNRRIPPLRYADVYRLKRDFPALTIVLNGGITTLAAASAEMAQVDGVMIGRAAYDNPYLLAGCDSSLYGDDAPTLSRNEIAAALWPYIARHQQQGQSAQQITRHLSGLFCGVPGAKSWRRGLSESRGALDRETYHQIIPAADESANRHAKQKEFIRTP